MEGSPSRSCSVSCWPGRCGGNDSRRGWATGDQFVGWVETQLSCTDALAEPGESLGRDPAYDWCCDGAMGAHAAITRPAAQGTADALPPAPAACSAELDRGGARA